MKRQKVNTSTSQNDGESHVRDSVGRFQGDFPRRTFDFGCAIVDVVDELPSNVKGWTIGKQLIRCGTSIGANIAEADQAISDAEFIQRRSIARKEAAETRYWLRVCRTKSLISASTADRLLGEVEQLLRISGTIIRKSQTNRRSDNSSC